MTDYVLPSQLRDVLIAYLSRRPYEEVAQGVRMLESLQEVEVKDSKTSE